MAISVLGGFLSATLSILHLTPFPGLILFSYFAPLPLFLIGLGIGLRSLYGAGLIAAGLVLLLEGPFLAIQFFIFSFLGPAFLTNRALLNRKNSSGKLIWYPSSFLLRDITFASGIVMLLALGTYLYFTYGESTHTLVKNLLETFDPQGYMKDAEPILVKIFPFLPGFFAFSWTIMMLVNAALAQGFLVRFKQNIRPSPSLEGISVPKSFSIALGISFILSLIGVGYVELLGKNVTFILAFPFFFMGLGVVHAWLRKTSHPTVGLTIFYLALSFFIWLALLIVLLGILKQWIEKRILPN